MSKLCICVGLVAVEVLAFEVCQCRSCCFWSPSLSKLSFVGSLCVEVTVFGVVSKILFWGTVGVKAMRG